MNQPSHTCGLTAPGLLLRRGRSRPYLLQREIPKSPTSYSYLSLSGVEIAKLTALGTAALRKENQNYKELGRLIDRDMSRLEKSVSHVTDYLDSLARVLLQNRTGLDLLCLQQGGLCMASGKQCCLYANHSGVKTASLCSNKEKDRRKKQDRLPIAGLNPISPGPHG